MSSTARPAGVADPDVILTVAGLCDTFRVLRITCTAPPAVFLTAHPDDIDAVTATLGTPDRRTDKWGVTDLRWAADTITVTATTPDPERRTTR